MESVKATKHTFPWTEFYMEFADKLLQYKEKRSELLSILEEVYLNLGLSYPFKEKNEPIDDICPFTVMGSFNKGITNENRIAIATEISRKIGVKTEVPTEFDGIPVLNNMKAWFFGFSSKRQPDDIPNLWSMFEVGVNYADSQTDKLQDEFIDIFNKVRDQRGVKWNITMGLYWIRPYFYLNLDERNRKYLLFESSPYLQDIIEISKLKMLPNGMEYLQIIKHIKTTFLEADVSHQSFPELSYAAWKAPRHGERRYWIYSPGQNAAKWEEFYSEGIIAIGWDEMEDLNQYPSKEAMKSKMKMLYGHEFSYMNDAHATWQFANEILPNDIVYVKKGNSKVIGRGIVESEYIFDPDREDYQHIHKVVWKNTGVWDHPGKAVTKTLTDITPYIEYVKQLEALFENEKNGNSNEPEVSYDSYEKSDFLNEVFLNEHQYYKLINLLKKKQNVIIQGAPGVGKTFAAKRLAYSVMGEKDSSRVSMVQFHQSYSYEDFIMGYRPTESGFELSEGPFYEFCKLAEKDSERDYFFIVDEINRGNLSKIFGELLMLIEKDKREQQLRLLYSNEYFTVPKNVYILGMMNTADRSLAMMDYALRRRFAFYTLAPAFDSEGFQEIVINSNNLKFRNLIDQVKALNSYISNDESLGVGFQIGHSYLCPDEHIDDEWLSAVIEYELLPLLEEYWFDEPAKVEHWKSRLLGAIND